MGNIVKIKGKPIGLFGFELALDSVKKRAEKEGLSPEQAAKELLTILSAKNYIPDSSKNDYLQAFKTYFQEAEPQTGPKVIRILGPGCVGCNRLEQVVMEVLAEQKIPADIVHVTDKDEIMRFGVDKTPALVIDDKVVSSGKIPSKAQVMNWLV